MAKQERDKIEYEFEDLRRNDDPVSRLTLAQLGMEEDDDAERQEGKKRKESAKRRKDDDEDDDQRSRRNDRDDDEDDGHDDDEEVTLSRKELARELTQARRQAERNARQEIDDARDEAAEVIGKLEKRLDTIERTGKSGDIDAEFQPKIEALEADIEAAMEKGESKKVIELTRKLSELTADRKIKLHQATSAKDDDNDDGDADERRAKRNKQQKLPRRAQRWLDEQDWWDDPEQAHVRAYLNKVDRELIKEGYEPTEDEYFEKLESRIEKKFPGVLTLTTRSRRRSRDEDDDEDDDRDDRNDRRSRSRRDDRDDDEDDDDRDDRSENRRRQRGAARRSPVSEGDRGGFSRGGEGGNRRQREQTTLTRAQVSNMRAFGLDPDKKEHVEEYLLEVRRQDRSSRR